MSAAQTEVDRQTVAMLVRLEEERCRVLRDGNAAALDAILDDDLQYTHMNGKIEGKAEYLEHMREIFDTRGGGPDFVRGDDIAVRILGAGSVAVMSGSLHSSNPNTGSPHRILLQVWVLRGDAWRLTASQTTPLP